MVQADIILERKLYKLSNGQNATEEEKRQMALKDAVSVRRLCSYIRYLSSAVSRIAVRK